MRSDGRGNTLWNGIETVPNRSILADRFVQIATVPVPGLRSSQVHATYDKTLEAPVRIPIRPFVQMVPRGGGTHSDGIISRAPFHPGVPPNSKVASRPKSDGTPCRARSFRMEEFIPR